MKNFKVPLLCLILCGTIYVQTARSQPSAIEGRLGLSVFTRGGGSTGLLLGGALEFPFQPAFSFRPELNLATHNGTPIEIGAKLRHEIESSSSRQKFYVIGGAGAWFYSGGPGFGIDFGGGIVFPLEGDKRSVPVEIRLGPIFGSGGGSFQMALTVGIRILPH